MKEYGVFCFLRDGSNNWKRFPITKDHYESFKKAHFFCVHALQIEESFALLIRGYIEFENELLKQAQRGIVWDWKTHSHDDAMTDRLELNFRLVSFLTMTQLYDDLTKRLSGKLYTKDIKCFVDIHKLKIELVTNDHNYRFLSDLRDFSQHVSLPIDTITTSPQIRELRKPARDLLIIPQLSAQRFKDRNGPYNLQGIETDKDGRIDIRKPLREFLLCVYQIQTAIRKMADELMPAHRNILIKTKEDFTCVDDVSYAPTELQYLENDSVVDRVSTFTRFLDSYDNNRKSHLLNSELTVSCASNYIVGINVKGK